MNVCLCTRHFLFFILLHWCNQDPDDLWPLCSPEWGHDRCCTVKPWVRGTSLPTYWTDKSGSEHTHRAQGCKEGNIPFALHILGNKGVCVCVCVQENRTLSFQRYYHVTDPFIKRLGLEAELQVSIIAKSVCVFILVPHSVFVCVWFQGHSGCVNCLEWNEKGE